METARSSFGWSPKKKVDFTDLFFCVETTQDPAKATVELTECNLHKYAKGVRKGVKIPMLINTVALKEGDRIILCQNKDPVGNPKRKQPEPLELLADGQQTQKQSKKQ